MIAGCPIDTSKMFYLNIMKKSMMKVFGANSPDKRLPFTFDLIEKAYHWHNMQCYEEFVLFTMMACATCGLMRTHEIFAKKKAVSADTMDTPSVKALYLRNLKPQYDKHGKFSHFSVLLRATKTDKHRQDVNIVWSKGPWPVSPAHLVMEMLQRRSILAQHNKKMLLTPKSPLFMFQNGKIVSRADMNTWFKALLPKLGLDTKRYKLYSFRIGGATSLARRGVDHKMIQMLGRWKSDAYQCYIRMDHNDLARVQTEAIESEIVLPNYVFLHQNVPPAEQIINN